MTEYSDKYTKDVILGVGIFLLILVIIFGIYLYFASQYQLYPFEIIYPEPDKTSGLYVTNREQYFEPLTKEGERKKQSMISDASTDINSSYRGTLNNSFYNPFN